MATKKRKKFSFRNNKSAPTISEQFRKNLTEEKAAGIVARAVGENLINRFEREQLQTKVFECLTLRINTLELRNKQLSAENMQMFVELEALKEKAAKQKKPLARMTK